MTLQLNKSGEFESIKKSLSKVSKSIYKTDLNYNAISLLEKSAKTGKVLETEECLPKKKKPKGNTPLQEMIKHHHKISDGIQIYQLPKLPFGAHNSYNQDKNFIKDHFKFDSSESHLTQNLDIFKRKFKLFDKNKAKSSKTYRNKKKTYEPPIFYAFKTKAGFLYCPLANEVSEIYEKDKAQYKKKAEEKFKTLATSPPTHIPQKPSTSSKKAQDALAHRLCPSRQATESPISQFYNTKYSVLFTSPDSKRPHTSLSINPTNPSKHLAYSKLTKH